MGKRKYKPKANPITPSLFTDQAHRTPEAAESMVYAMACVEVVANWSPRGRELYQELVKAWAAPGAKAFYEQFIAMMPEEEVAQWKEWMKHPELSLLQAPHAPVRTRQMRRLTKLLSGMTEGRLSAPLCLF